MTRGQGAFEYLLMLGGVVMVAVMVILMMQNATQSANNALGNNQNSYHDLVTQGVKDTLGINASPSSAILSCTVGPDTSSYISNDTDCGSACRAAGYSNGTTVCHSGGCSGSCNACTTISCYGTAWNMITSCTATGSCRLNSCNCTR